MYLYIIIIFPLTNICQINKELCSVVESTPKAKQKKRCVFGNPTDRIPALKGLLKLTSSPNLRICVTYYENITQYLSTCPWTTAVTETDGCQHQQFTQLELRLLSDNIKSSVSVEDTSRLFPQVVTSQSLHTALAYINLWRKDTFNDYWRY
ncbi:hypothetical protein GQR58_022234 [Nymphon striatum]|nr:hypothetical protein GQR58_022234 [Nymphon striatum]